MDSLTTPARSWLFVPATRRDRFAKAVASGADRVIVDLEDAVAPEQKAEAREALLRAAIPTGRPVYLRVNAASTPWFERDVAVASSIAVSGIFLPKADTPDDVARAAERLGGDKPIVPIVETAAGVWNALDVARSPRVERLVFGALDFQLDTGMYDENGAYDFVRSRVVVASRVARVGAPIDSVCLAIHDDALLERDAARGRRFGFCGKLCIHPNQVRVANGTFRPTAEEVEWARDIRRERDARPADAVFSHKGALVDRPVIERADQILALASALGLG